jgi:hypothetical protein
MKAWNDVASYYSLYWTGPDDNPKSKWYLDKGVKIERFEDDGRVEIHDVMTQGDKFRKINEEQLEYFEKYGWEAGCTKVNIDHIEHSIGWLEHLGGYTDDPDSNHIKIEKLRKKLLHNQEKLSTFVRNKSH